MGKVCSLLSIDQFLNKHSLASRSVHNIRIKRLWRDLTLGFGHKWKLFFQGLEMHERLNRHADSHIWLLQYLFLPSINRDAVDWAESWNHHSLSQHGQRQSSPKDMFFFGMIQNGMRGLPGIQEPADEPIEDIDSYGIDWEVYDDPHLLAHHNEQNRQEAIDALDPNPFRKHLPHHLSHVEVEEAPSPFTDLELDIFDHELQQLPFYESNSMDSRRLLWRSALEICEDIYDKRL